MIKTTNPLRRNAWAVFLYRGRQIYSYLLRNSNLGDKERMVELLARRYMTEPENIVVDIETAFLDEDIEISLTSETAMSGRISPFRTIGSLCSFIARQLGLEE